MKRLILLGIIFASLLAVSCKGTFTGVYRTDATQIQTQMEGDVLDLKGFYK